MHGEKETVTRIGVLRLAGLARMCRTETMANFTREIIIRS